MYKVKIVILYTNDELDCHWNHGWVDWDGLDTEELNCIIKENGKSEEKNLQEIVDKSIKVLYAVAVETFDITEGKYHCGSCDCYFDEPDDGDCPFCGSRKVAEGLYVEVAE
jgi:hypothetical protein